MIEGALPAARAVHFAATLLIEGCVVFQFMIAAPALNGVAGDAGFARVSYRTVVAAWIVAVLSGAAWLLLLAAELAGASVAEAMANGTTWTLLTQTQFGTTWLARAAGFVLLLTCFSPRFRRAGESWRTAVLIAVSMALTGSLAWSGHGAASAGTEGDLHLAADILHLIASGIWLGGLLPFAILLKLRPNSAAAISLRFSSLATACVLVLVATGLLNAWAILPRLEALTGTLYGQLLLAKIALFLLMLAFASVNRFVLTPRLAIANLSGQARSRLIVHSGCELALGLAILALVGVLGTLAPMPEEAHRHAIAATRYSIAGGGASAAGPRSGRSSIAIRNAMPQAATKAQAANT